MPFSSISNCSLQRPFRLALPPLQFQPVSCSTVRHVWRRKVWLDSFFLIPEGDPSRRGAISSVFRFAETECQKRDTCVYIYILLDGIGTSTRTDQNDRLENIVAYDSCQDKCSWTLVSHIAFPEVCLIFAEDWLLCGRWFSSWKTLSSLCSLAPHFSISQVIRSL